MYLFILLSILFNDFIYLSSVAFILHSIVGADRRCVRNGQGAAALGGIRAPTLRLRSVEIRFGSVPSLAFAGPAIPPAYLTPL